MSQDDKMKPSRPSLTQHNNHTSGEVSLNTQSSIVTQKPVRKRRCSEAGLDAEDITRNNPIWAAAEKGQLSQDIHTSKTALQLINAHHGTLSKDMARVYLTVHALRGAIREFEIRKREQQGHLKPDHHKDMMNLKRRLVAAERRERRQKSKEEEVFEKMLKGLQTPHIANPKRRKLSEPELNISKSKPIAGSVDKAYNDDGVKMIKFASYSSGEADATKAEELPKLSQQEAAGANVASKTAAKAAKNDPDGQVQSPAKSRPCDDRAGKSREEPATPGRPFFSLADLQAKIKSDEDKLVQKYMEKPRGVSFSAWCTQQDLPKQRPAGRDPVPIKEHGLKRSLEALDTGNLDMEKLRKTNNKRQKLETSLAQHSPPIQPKVVNLTGPSQGDLLRRQSLKNANSKRLLQQSSSSGTTPSKASESLQATRALEAANNASLAHEEPDVTHETGVSTTDSDGLTRSVSSSPIEKETPKLLIAGATGSLRPTASTSNKTSGDNVKAAITIPNAMQPSSEGLMQACPSQNQPPLTADINHDSPSPALDEETWCQNELEIPSKGTKEYDRYVDSRLKEYLVEKEVEAKRAREVDKTLSEDLKRTKSSEVLMAYTASLLECGQALKRRYKIHKKRTQDLTEGEFAITRTRFPVRPVLPPMIGHEIAAKVHLEGTWTHAKHRFRFPAKPNDKIEPLWKSPESRPLPPSPRSSTIYQSLRGRELYRMGPKRARTRYVPPRPILQSASAVSLKAGES